MEVIHGFTRDQSRIKIGRALKIVEKKKHVPDSDGASKMAQK